MLRDRSIFYKLCFRVFLVSVVSIFYGVFQAQSSYLKSKEIKILKDTVSLDSLSIVWGSVSLFRNDSIIPKENYTVLHSRSKLIWKSDLPTVVTATYRVYPVNFSKRYFNRDKSILNTQDTLQPIPLGYTGATKDDIFGNSGLNKAGSISRGFFVGNNQDLSVNSELNLNLSGSIGNGIEIAASISDNNIPIQPQGNTQQLQDFDQVFIKVFTDDWKISAGDFWMKNTPGYFLKYNKRVQGAGIELYHNDLEIGDSSNFKTSAGIAISKGKFGRNVIQGIENNQGPYRLTGNENETFIIVLSGTERVFIDGKLLERGQEYDYIIDYNTAEITFTANQLITKDKRITVEFQYADKNYARSIITLNHSAKINTWDMAVQVYSEQDAKNQPLQQELDDNDREALFNAGDDIFMAAVNSVDSVGFDENTNRYEKLDSLGYEILQISTNPNTAIYNVIFTDVGANNGSYVLSEFSAFGKVYQWVAPDTVGNEIIFNGNFSPVQVLVSPKKRQLITAHVSKYIGRDFKTGVELAYSNFDENTFSSLDAQDDQGVAAKYYIKGNSKLRKDWKVISELSLETTSEYFNPIERFRAVEFTRNWNFTENSEANQYIGDLTLGLSRKDSNLIRYKFNSFNHGNEYAGYKNGLELKNRLKQGAIVNYVGSYLNTQSDISTSFYRHKSLISQRVKFFNLGYVDEFERNLFRKDSLLNTSYQFYDYEFFISNADTLKTKFKIFYRERIDYLQKGNVLAESARALNPGFSFNYNKNVKNQFLIKTNLRILSVSGTTITNVKDEQGILSRVEYRLRWFKGGLTNVVFYEVGSGQELRREFIYIEVPAGQGVYTWVDYNEDGIKDLNEFEIAEFTDQATYLRISTPSNTYVNVFSNQFSNITNITLRNWFRKKDIISKTLSKISANTSIRQERKTTLDDWESNLNPFISDIADEFLQGVNQTLRHSTFYNRLSAKFGLEHTYLTLRNKQLLLSGFDERIKTSNEFKVRIGIGKTVTLDIINEIEEKQNTSDYTTGRNYDLFIVKTESKITYQPSTKFRINLIANYTDKKNNPNLSSAEAFITKTGTEITWNQLKTGSLNFKFNYLKINYTGETNTPIAFEMLESLQPGNNMVWTLGYQRTFANNLQLTINYNGRSSENTPVVHAGGMQLRAFF